MLAALVAGTALAPSATAGDPQVTNVRARQISGTGQVEVLYDLSGAPASGATVSVAFSATGDAPYDITPAASALSGDIGPGIGDGSDRRVVWDAAGALPPDTHGTSFRAAVTAVDPSGGGDTITIVLPGGVEMDLVWVPAGTFMMGSPPDERGRRDREDLHQVTLTQGYYLGKYEVTQAQWEALMASNPSDPNDPASCTSYDLGVGPDFPVFCVSWDDICGRNTASGCLLDSFVGRLNAYLGDTRFRMPTEAEWERAARADTQAEFSFPVPPDWDTGCGSFSEAAPYMWWCGDNMPSGAKPVGSKLPNGFGLHDMHGNLWECVADRWQEHLGFDPQTDPTGPTTGLFRVLRGGYWNSHAGYCRSASRDSFPSIPDNNFGFRLARSP